jgi:hypothetical protein
MISPTATTELRDLRTIAPQRGQALAVSAIMPPHVRHEVIRLMFGSRSSVLPPIGTIWRWSSLVVDVDWPPGAASIRVLDADGREVHSEVKGDRPRVL